MTNKNLILTRKTGDRVKIYTPGKEICTITVTNISNKQCKLAFEADSSVRIDREEIYQEGDKNEANISKSKKTTSKRNNPTGL
jgi:carbon storage regulator CsrA